MDFVYFAIACFLGTLSFYATKIPLHVRGGWVYLDFIAGFSVLSFVVWGFVNLGWYAIILILIFVPLTQTLICVTNIFGNLYGQRDSTEMLRLILTALNWFQILIFAYAMLLWFGVSPPSHQFR